MTRSCISSATCPARAAAEAPQRALLGKHRDLPEKLPPLGEALKRGVPISYTQWEAWLALYHEKQLDIAKAVQATQRGPNYKPTDASRAAQEGHLARLREAKRYPIEFRATDDLAKQVLASGILDLLVEDRAAQASVPRQEATRSKSLRRLSQTRWRAARTCGRSRLDGRSGGVPYAVEI